jgi:hypothetical protein
VITAVSHVNIVATLGVAGNDGKICNNLAAVIKKYDAGGFCFFVIFE